MKQKSIQLWAPVSTAPCAGTQSAETVSSRVTCGVGSALALILQRGCRDCFGRGELQLAECTVQPAGWNPRLLVRGGTEKVCACRLKFPEASGAERFATALWSSANQMCVYGCNKFNFEWN